MPYSNGTKLANGATVAIGATTYEDAVIVGVPSEVGELVDITTLGSSRREYLLSDIMDSDEITIMLPYTGQAETVSTTAVTCVIVLPKITKTLTFTALIMKWAPQPAEVNGKLMLEITLKPTTAVAIT